MFCFILWMHIAHVQSWLQHNYFYPIFLTRMYRLLRYSKCVIRCRFLVAIQLWWWHVNNFSSHLYESINKSEPKIGSARTSPISSPEKLKLRGRLCKKVIYKRGKYQFKYNTSTIMNPLIRYGSDLLKQTFIPLWCQCHCKSHLRFSNQAKTTWVIHNW